MRRGMVGVVGLWCFLSAGCAINVAKRSPWDIQQLAELSDQLDQFKTLAQLKAEEAEQLRQAKALLEQQLGASQASIGYDERGLVTRLLDQVLFDSGKAQLRSGAFPVLEKVARVLTQFPNQPVGVEGHTDNQPIRHSGWADNMALSVARANAVLAYLAEHGVDRARLTAIGYGDAHPVASNRTVAARQRNRRVEIVMLPHSAQGAYQAQADRVAAASHRRSAYSK